MYDFKIPDQVVNIINGRDSAPCGGEYIEKLNPHNGQILYDVARSKREDVTAAVEAAVRAHHAWAAITPVKRGEVLYSICDKMNEHKKNIARIVALETGKSLKDALGETEGAILQGRFMAGEGQRFFGRTTTSAVPNKYAMTIREPVGVCGLIIAANTPIANVAWKVFPALICGNSAVLKSSEDTPLTSFIFSKIAQEAGLPDGVLNVIQGLGEEAGAPIVEHEDVDLISFTGSTEVGRYIARVAGERLAKICLELGGKNPLVVCDDADLENAAKWVLLSAFSNAGQRCASAGRIIVFASIYEKFKKLIVERTAKLKVGPADEDDLGPVINEKQLNNMLAVIKNARERGVSILIGGHRLTDENHKSGYYMAPTLIENAGINDEISVKELFGPIACLYKVSNFDEAMESANNSPYGLTACIHTKDFNRAVEFTRRVRAGVAVVNGGTYGSEPHMPFGGVKNSGNGWREPGPEAIDVYSNIKDIYQFVNI